MASVIICLVMTIPDFSMASKIPLSVMGSVPWSIIFFVMESGLDSSNISVNLANSVSTLILSISL